MRTPAPFLLTIVAAAVIFAPARRRLKLLQEASVRLGAGDLTARAPAAGGDEVAQVAASFNRMAEELAARDEALRTSDQLRRQMLADVSNELKTPLTAMRTYVETLQAEDISLDRDTRQRYFATLERETIRLDTKCDVHRATSHAELAEQAEPLNSLRFLRVLRATFRQAESTNL